MKFAKAVYCPGVDKWYVRLGSQQGVDCMFPGHTENAAKLMASQVNASLKRELEARRKRKKIKN